MGDREGEGEIERGRRRERDREGEGERECVSGHVQLFIFVTACMCECLCLVACISAFVLFHPHARIHTSPCACVYVKFAYEFELAYDNEGRFPYFLALPSAHTAPRPAT